MGKEIIDGLRDSLNSDVGIIIAFVSTLIWIVQSGLYLMKKISENAIITLIICGIIFPCFILYFIDSSTLVHKILRILAIYCLISVLLSTVVLWIYSKWRKDYNTVQDDEE